MQGKKNFDSDQPRWESLNSFGAVNLCERTFVGLGDPYVAHSGSALEVS